jgi:Zn-dependent peptidase ImmA (M78 family)/transcriptional regulator with XRE-family HTH domain
LRPGTPGFVGERLRSAREARGITATALAEILRITPAAISHYEKGAQSPGPEIMRALADKLSLPVRHFLRPMPAPSVGTGGFYRSMSAATKTDRVRAERRQAWVREIVAYLRGYVAFPKISLPSFGIPADPNEISDSYIEAAAEEARKFWGLGSGPVAHCVWLAENNGVVAVHSPLGAETLDSFSEWADGTPYIFLGSERGCAVRDRLNVGHELGHLLLHRAIDDKHKRFIPSDHRKMEEQANRFAGAFLLPAVSFGRDIYAVTLEALRGLKAKWKVSIGAMLKRAETLGFVSGHQLERTWITYSRRGWRLREPLDDELELEQPSVLRTAFEQLVGAGANVRAEILSTGLCSPADIEALVGLPTGFLSEDGPAQVNSPVVRVLHPRRTPSPERAERGKIVPFSRPRT